MNLLQLIRPGTIYFGDCLEIARLWQPEQVDLIYLDPPFNSKRNYNILFGTETGHPSSQYLAFHDTWQWDAIAAERVRAMTSAVNNPASTAIRGLQIVLGSSGMLSYLSYMAERLVELKALLKSTGSIYLHCDPTASHYMKILMDSIFEPSNFQNELVWHYTNASRGKRRWAKSHDVILWYGRSKDFKFNREEVLAPFQSGMTEWRYTQGGQAGRPMPKGKTPDDVIALPSLNAMAAERTGYPTQKPEELLARLVKAGTEEGDLVLDPFCGCGTTLLAAHANGRKWAGVDISAFAVENVVRWRLDRRNIAVKTAGIPTDLDSARLLADRDAFKFEAWAVNQVPGLAPNTKQVGDGGIDGRGMLLNPISGSESRLVLAQVKKGRPTMDSVRAFRGVVENQDESAAAGVMITLESNWTRGMEAEFAKAGSFDIEGSAQRWPRLQFWSIAELFARQSRPDLPPMADPVTGKELSPTSLWAAGRGQIW